MRFKQEDNEKDLVCFRKWYKNSLSETRWASVNIPLCSILRNMNSNGYCQVRQITLTSLRKTVAYNGEHLQLYNNWLMMVMIDWLAFFRQLQIRNKHSCSHTVALQIAADERKIGILSKLRTNKNGLSYGLVKESYSYRRMLIGTGVIARSCWKDIPFVLRHSVILCDSSKFLPLVWGSTHDNLLKIQHAVYYDFNGYLMCQRHRDTK